MVQLLGWAALLAALLLPGEQHALSREFVGQAQRGWTGLSVHKEKLLEHRLYGRMAIATHRKGITWRASSLIETDISKLPS